jgi:Amt family ammonium transporter
VGFLATGACFLAVRVRPRLGLDDSLDVFAIHGVAATLGALLTGLLASKAVNPDGADGSLALLGIQAVGVVATLAWSGLVSFALFKLVGLVTPLRADEQDEFNGLDLSEAGERGYVLADEQTFGH